MAVLLLPIGACGTSETDRERARAELEAEFGRRAAEPVPATDDARRDDDPAEAAQGGTGPGDEGSAGESPGGESPAGRPPPVETPAGSERARGESPAQAGTEAQRTGDPVEDPPDAPPAAAPGASSPDVDSLLAEAEDAYAAVRSLRAAFVQRVDVPLLERSAEGRGTWYQRGRDRFRMDFDDPPDDVYVADGTYLWLYQPSQQPDQVIQCELASGALETGTADLLGRILSEARTSYDGVYVGSEEISGVVTHHLGLTPRGASEYREVRVWVAAGDALVRRFRIEEQNETLRTVTLSRLEPNVTLADSFFRFTPEVPVFTC